MIKSDFHWAKIGSRSRDPSDPMVAEPWKETKDHEAEQRRLDPYVARVPVIRSTLPGKMQQPSQVAAADSVTCASAASQSIPLPPRSVVNNVTLPHAFSSKARRFHLEKDRSLSPSQVSAGHGIQKRQSKGKLAVFAERRIADVQRFLSLQPTSHVNTSNEPSPEASATLLGSPRETEMRDYKRPNAALEEVKWRAKTWNRPANTKDYGSSSIYDSSRQEKAYLSYEEESLELAMQLQELAMQITKENADRTSTAEQQPQQRFQPRPQKSRLVKAHYDREVPRPGPDDSEGDFVYDTYVRSEGPIKAEQHQNAAHLDTLMSDAPTATYGLLVIEHEDEESWEIFAEDNDSDRGWDTDDEDENGKSDAFSERLRVATPPAD